MTLGDLDLQFSGKLRNSCPNSCAKKTVALHGLVKAHYWEQKKRTAYSKATWKKVWRARGNMSVEALVLFPEVIKSHPIL